MSEPSKSNTVSTESNNHLIRLAIALGLALICWPTALYALHGFFFRSSDTSSNGQLIFAGVVTLIALASTWVAVFLLSKSEE